MTTKIDIGMMKFGVKGWGEVARFQVDCPDNLLSDLEGLFDDVADEMIDAALPVYQREIQSQLESHRDTGELDRKSVV